MTHEKPRINPVGIQYLSSSLHKQLFENKKISKKEELLSEKEKEDLINLSKNLLKHHGLLGKKTKISEPISFELPKLQGNSLDEHFQKLGYFASDPYLKMCEKKFQTIVRKPNNWVFKAGWYRYEDGKEPVQVKYPLEDTFVFDVECLYNISHYPTLATAVSDCAWYSWCSPFLCGDNNPNHLIPLNTLEKTQLIIGHNVGYDRSKVLEEYNFTPSKAFFIDTMSLHIASSGICSRQRPQWMKNMKKIKSEEKNVIHTKNDDDPWIQVSSMNSLEDIALLHCNIKINKESRNMFDTFNKQEIIDNYQDAVNYCATDVETTSKIFDKLFPLFREKCPHPVSFGAIRFLSSCILPVKPSKWKKYIQNSEEIYQESKNSIEQKIITIIEEVVKLKDIPELIEADPWLKQLDWTVKPIRVTKKGLPIKGQKLPNYPEWYRSLFKNKMSKKPSITIKNRLIPLFFKLSWEGSPVIWTDTSGWCFKVHVNEAEKFKKKNYVLETEFYHNSADKDYLLFKIPHPNGPEFKCTTLLSKPYISYFERGILQSNSDLAHEALKINSSGSYWMSARERIMSQFVVSKEDHLDQFKSIDNQTDDFNDLGIIIPRIIPMGTVTRRSVENTWLTASNADKNRIGSELKTKIEAPENYSFVGADVDSEELWIASLVGDSVFNIHGGTAIGWMTLEGTKSDGTDLHTKTAQILGCSRGEAKIFNYGRIYGAGVKFATQILKKFNPSLSDDNARETAEKLYEYTKGKAQHSKIFKKFWYGGSESILFNKLEHIADQDEPRTPVLGAGITFSLMRRNLGNSSFLTSRINWAIQSSGVDYLHLLCCSMNYLIEKYHIKARMCISIHDEVRFLVKDEDKYRVALALQISNIWTRAIFCEQMGIDDLPQNCAFFSAVDVDKVIRKEVDMDCITPSNIQAIPHGESVDIKMILNNPKSQLGKPDDSISVTKYPYHYREPVFSYYNKAYTKEFLNYFLKMQVQTTKWKVSDLEKSYIQETMEKSLIGKTQKQEYTFLDYMREIKSGKRQKMNIMENIQLLKQGNNIGSNREGLCKKKVYDSDKHEEGKILLKSHIIKKGYNHKRHSGTCCSLVKKPQTSLSKSNFLHFNPKKLIQLELQHRIVIENNSNNVQPLTKRRNMSNINESRMFKNMFGNKVFDTFSAGTKSSNLSRKREHQFIKNRHVNKVLHDALSSYSGIKQKNSISSLNKSKGLNLETINTESKSAVCKNEKKIIHVDRHLHHNMLQKLQ